MRKKESGRYRETRHHSAARGNACYSGVAGDGVWNIGPSFLAFVCSLRCWIYRTRTIYIVYSTLWYYILSGVMLLLFPPTHLPRSRIVAYFEDGQEEWLFFQGCSTLYTIVANSTGVKIELIPKNCISHFKLFTILI